MVCPKCGCEKSIIGEECCQCFELPVKNAASNAVELSTPVAAHEAAPTLSSAQNSTNYSATPFTTDDKPSFLMALIGFAIPLVGLIIFFADRSSRPLQARSAGRGALTGFGLTVVSVVLFFAFALSPYSAQWKGQWQQYSASQTAASVLPVGESEPILVTSKVDLAYDQIQTQGTDLIESGKFEDLEKQAAQYRKSQDKFLHGFWKIAALYQGMSEVSDSASDTEWEKRRQLLVDWAARSPRSITAHVALVRCYHAGAYRARGTDWASKVKPEQWKLMNERLDKAAGVLAASASMQNQCPGWFAAAQRAVFLKGRSQKEFDAITDEGLRLFPDYDDFHFMRAKSLMVRWYGKNGDWQAYARRVADEVQRSKTKNGDELYAKIVWYIQDFADATNSHDLDGIDWERAKRGFDSLLKKPDSFAAASPCARVAWLVGDREKAKVLFKSTLDNHMDDGVWADKTEFQTARQWALR